MSDQAAEQPGGEQGSLDAGVSRSDVTSSEVVTVSAVETSAAANAPSAEPIVSEFSPPEPSMSEPSMFGPFEAEAASSREVKAEASAQATQPEAASEKSSQAPGKDQAPGKAQASGGVIVMPRGERAWAGHGIHIEPEAAARESVFGKRRIAAIAAVLVLAVMAGAAGGALATASLIRGPGDVASNSGSQSAPLEASLARLDADIQALKAGLDHTSKLALSQFNKTSERLDKVERAQAEPAARLAKLGDAVDKLQHTLPVPPSAVAAASPASKDTTGSIASAPAQQASAAPKPDIKAEVGRLPTLEDWVLRDVGYGGALIGGRHGNFEVYAGDMIPGLGRVDAIRRQDGRWVVVTSRGLIVAR